MESCCLTVPFFSAIEDEASCASCLRKQAILASPTGLDHKYGNCKSGHKVIIDQNKRKDTEESSSSLLLQKEGKGVKSKKGKKITTEKTKRLKVEDNVLPESTATQYIHVRARRGQATDSHSLAERTRREKISERMKILQRLVPGCDKVTGKALVLDEIINYVQSLQNQVEFLSMKLACVNPSFYECGTVELDAFMSLPESLSASAYCRSQAAAFYDANTSSTFPANSFNGCCSTSFLLQDQMFNDFQEQGTDVCWKIEEERNNLLGQTWCNNEFC